MIKTRILRAKMIYAGITAQDLADAQGWSISTAYRKINGKVAWLAPELRVVKALLNLDDSTMNAIFFTSELS